MERYSIGIDLGTSSVKAVLFSEKRGIAFKASEKFEYESSRLPSGSKYLGIDLEKFYFTICKLIKWLSEKSPKTRSFQGLQWQAHLETSSFVMKTEIL